MNVPLKKYRGGIKMYIYSINNPEHKFEIVDEKARELINNISTTRNLLIQTNDWNQALTSGSYYSSTTATNLPTSVVTSISTPIYGEVKCITIDSKNIIYQSLFINVNNSICAYIRCRYENTWTNWIDWTKSALDDIVITTTEFTTLLNKS